MFRKKILPLMTAIMLIAVCSMIGLTACNPDTQEGVKSITVYVGENNPIAVETEALYLHEVLIELKESGEISAYEYSESEYGAFVTKIGGLELPSLYSWYSVWHDIDEFGYKSVYKEAEAAYNPSFSIILEEDDGKFIGVKLGDKNLYMSGKGVSALPVRDGATYAVLVVE